MFAPPVGKSLDRYLSSDGQVLVCILLSAEQLAGWRRVAERRKMEKSNNDEGKIKLGGPLGSIGVGSAALIL